ncbi:MAG: Rid family detoxifying hydrolase [Desulfobacterales bacterium]|nr:Rid family detoxifying hydrolase [Desulfobacterales bacterium]MDX2512811.1 Rid family detoxifying hydrolase [Desulfobacterales bacterium]
MVEKVSFHTEKAAELGGPYSQAVIYKDMIYISGQGAVDPLTNQLKTGTIEKETKLALENIKIIMEAAGSSLDKILQVRVYLTDIREYARFNEVYRKYFKDPQPARTCVEVKKLPFGLRIEIDTVGYI